MSFNAEEFLKQIERGPPRCPDCGEAMTKLHGWICLSPPCGILQIRVMSEAEWSGSFKRNRDEKPRTFIHVRRASPEEKERQLREWGLARGGADSNAAQPSSGRAGGSGEARNPIPPASPARPKHLR